MTGIQGRFLWHELVTPDTDAASAFYAEVVGWGTTKWERGPMPYTLLMAGETAVGGVVLLHEKAKAMGAPPQWLAYIGTADVDATVARATELGAQVFSPPMDMPEVGRFAVLKDPAGGTFALLSPAGDAPEALRTDQPGGVAWNELLTTDVAAAFEFYQALFGWPKGEAMDMGDFGPYQLLGEKEESFGGIGRVPPQHEGPPFWLHYVTVDELSAALDRVKTCGGTVVHGPTEVPGGDLVAQCFDPQGVAFALHQAAIQ